MGIQAQEDALFQEWRAARPRFVADGAVDEDAYSSSERRILFMLKEVNDPEGGDWDLRQFIKDGGRSYTWNNITRWIEGIRNLSIDIPWKDLEQVDNERRAKALRSVAAVNLKKSPGSHTSDPSEIAVIAEQDKAFLNRQVSLYQADLIICCGVSDTFHWLVAFDRPPEWRQTSRGIAYHEYRPGKFVVAYAHPEARVADSILYYGLIDAIREIAA
ncbi:hypothetical protein LX59_02343 [Azomonas agilis]|uniref:Uracil DNA glycosylase superfamily protein n=1 Tax=Azomonas agilis TaxID=116849 RepID=A0A562I0P3_9GAMM|nr:hypothetical protein [Azomonas agilis]TWH64396.1 hypothetical protein LX59_02343 [Azomonas agilis]